MLIEGARAGDPTPDPADITPDPRAPRGGDSPVHVAEGEADALALALAPWCGPGGVSAAGGTSGKGIAPALGTGPVVLHCDGDKAGRKAVLAAADAIETAAARSSALRGSARRPARSWRARSSASRSG